MDVYVETSGWSFAFADDAPDYRADTLRFFDRCRAGDFRATISQAVLDEIAEAPEPRHTELVNLVREVRPVLVPVSRQAIELAQAFVSSGAVPPSKPEDALHVAVAMAAGLPHLVSWNFKHIVSPRRADRFNVIALTRGFSDTIRITTPAELAYEE